jgi:hypothetical protein
MEVVVKDGFTSTIDIPVRLNAFTAGTIFVLKSPSSPRPIAAKWRRLFAVGALPFKRPRVLFSRLTAFLQRWSVQRLCHSRPVRH